MPAVTCCLALTSGMICRDLLFIPSNFAIKRTQTNRTLILSFQHNNTISDCGIASRWALAVQEFLSGKHRFAGLNDPKWADNVRRSWEGHFRSLTTQQRRPFLSQPRTYSEMGGMQRRPCLVGLSDQDSIGREVLQTFCWTQTLQDIKDQNQHLELSQLEIRSDVSEHPKRCREWDRLERTRQCYRGSARLKWQDFSIAVCYEKQIWICMYAPRFAAMCVDCRIQLFFMQNSKALDWALVSVLERWQQIQAA